VLIRINKWTVGILAFVFAGVVFTGVSLPEFSDSAWAQIHSLAGRFLVQATLVAFGLSLAVIIQRVIKRKRLLVGVRGSVPLFTLLMVLHNSFTGYLGPSKGDYSLESDTHLRFRFFHLFAQPIVVGVLIVGWWWMLRRMEREPVVTQLK